MKQKICKSCGYVGRPVHDTLSSFSIDVFAWLLWFAVGMITTIFPLVIIGPLFTLVHIAMFRTKRCPKCENLDMVSLNSNAAKRMFAHEQGYPDPWDDEHVASH